jgi:predicted phage terminase large subunit-like protein
MKSEVFSENTLADSLELFKSDEFRKTYLSAPEVNRIAFNWRLKWLSTAHPHQITPSGDWYNIHLLLAGRGAGKTRVASEQIGWWAWQMPNSRWLVSAPTSSDVRATCFEGDSGLISVIPPELVADYNKSYHEIKLINGSLIKGIPASEPERFRGGQYHGAWLDELAAWDYLREAWDMIQFGVRLGNKTMILATTTPKPKELILELIERDGEDVCVTTASTYSNIDNLAPSFKAQILSYEGTKIGRQEIYAEIIDPEESGIIVRDWFRLWPSERAFPEFEYILQSYDTAYTERTTGDPTACSVWGIFKPLDRPLCAMLIDCWSEHLAYPDLKPKLLEDYTAVYGEPGKRVDLVLIEEKASGQSLIQDLGRAHVQVRGYNPGKLDKVQRVHLISNIIAAGRVYVPESTKRKGYVRDWAEPFVQQVCSFPETNHDDYVDSMSQALRYLRDAGFLDIDPDPHYDDDDYVDDSRIKRVNPYAA